MDTMQAIADETKALRRGVRELAALSTLSAVWSQSDPREIAAGLCRVLSSSLPAAFVYVRVSGHGGAVVEVAGTQRGPATPSKTKEIRTAIEALWQSGRLDQTQTIANPLGSGIMRLAVTPIGHRGRLWGCGRRFAAAQLSRPDGPITAVRRRESSCGCAATTAVGTTSSS